VTVKLAVRQPTDRSRIILAFSTGAGMESFARATEAAGFSGVYEADRPLPSRKWTAGCGHRDFDPLVTLSYVAGATERPLLQTKMYVLAYRSPFLAAKRSHRWDRFTGDRVLLRIGAGYLPSEFAALGVEHSTRGAATRRAIRFIWQAPRSVQWDGEHVISRLGSDRTTATTTVAVPRHMCLRVKQRVHHQ
jgi:alkanesulfonate monooxygenase SsuD/methylene tetrahydromethanopterin reductase-like flavin-dependent oxidoreductase (luciferase family)